MNYYSIEKIRTIYYLLYSDTHAAMLLNQLCAACGAPMHDVYRFVVQSKTVATRIQSLNNEIIQVAILRDAYISLDTRVINFVPNTAVFVVLPILLVLSPVLRRRDEKGRFLRWPDVAIRKILFIYLFFC